MSIDEKTFQPLAGSISSSSCATSDTLIVGGGIVGLSLAYELARRGQQVTVLEKESCGRAASWAGVGILPPVAQREVHDPLEQLRSLSHRLLADWSQEIKRTTGIDTGYRQCGGVYLATTPGEAAALAANRLWWEELGIEAKRWNARQLAEHEPDLKQLTERDMLREIVYLAGECQLRTPWYVRGLLTACRQLGVSIVENCQVEECQCSHGRVTRLVTHAGTYSAANVCLTAGPWTRNLLEQIGQPSGILPVRGQVLLMRPGALTLKRIINEGHRYLVPRDDGRLLVGSNEEETGFVCETTSAITEELRSWAETIMPSLRDVPLEKSWAGLRPGSFDSYPYIGPLSNCDNLFVAAGHFRAGIHLSAGTAHVLADLITTGRTEIDLTPFRASRG